MGMDFIVLNKKLEATENVDIYNSIIWTDRFDIPGEFEISTLATKEMFEKFPLEYYILSSHSDRLMIIETKENEADPENGSKLRITGRSLESILERRIVWEFTQLDGKLESQIERLFNDAIINPSNEKRKIANFKFRYSNDPYISEIDFKHNFIGRSLLTIVQEVCSKYHIGFKITLEGKDFVFQFYTGKDHSYNQVQNPWIIFSEENGNLLNGSSIHSTTDYYNVGLVMGEHIEGVKSDRVSVADSDSETSGIERRELYIDAGDLQHEFTNEEGAEIKLNSEEYKKELENRGIEKLNDAKEIHKFEGEGNSAEDDNIVGVDYDIGDICVFEDEFGLTEEVRVIEIIYSENNNENKHYPTFRALSEETDVEITDDADDGGSGGDVIVPGS